MVQFPVLHAAAGRRIERSVCSAEQCADVPASTQCPPPLKTSCQLHINICQYFVLLNKHQRLMFVRGMSASAAGSMQHFTCQFFETMSIVCCNVNNELIPFLILAAMIVDTAGKNLHHFGCCLAYNILFALLCFHMSCCYFSLILYCILASITGKANLAGLLVGRWAL